MDVTAALKQLLEDDVLFDSVEIPDVKRPYIDPFMGETDRLVLAPDALRFPSEIRRLCANAKCQDVMDWQIYHDDHFVDGGLTVSLGYSAIEYRCRHTDKTDHVTFFVAATHAKPSTTVRLIGQDPQPMPYVSPRLQQALGEVDRARYSNALRCRAMGFGVGALVYVRRVIEDEMDRILDLIIEALPEDDAEIREDITRRKGAYQFSEKAAVADARLPASFFPGNQNPFARLHDLTSQGVHQLDDVESCERFDEAQELFEMLFEKLLRERDTKRLYRERLTTLKRKQSKI